MYKMANKKQNKRQNKSQGGDRVKRVILAIAIAILFAFFIGIGIDAFYPNPEWEDYCEHDRYDIKQNLNSAECEEVGGRWNEFEEARIIPEDRMSCKKVEQNEDEMILSCISESKGADAENGFCDLNYYCEEEYDGAQEGYNKVVFIVTAIIGLLVIVLSVALQMVSVSAGLMSGGILVILYGTMRYWEYSSNMLRMIILGISLVVLIWLGYKRLNK